MRYFHKHLDAIITNMSVGKAHNNEQNNLNEVSKEIIRVNN